jgi:hypothetical protein
MDLAIIVPTRGRPDAARELAQVFADTTTGHSAIVFVVDQTDPKLEEYHEKVPPFADLIVRDTNGMVPALNTVAGWLADDGGVFAIGFMGDDHRPRTTGWDEAYLEALRELGTGIVYGNDLFQGANLPTQCAMTSNIIRKLGFMAPPNLQHLYVDNFWRDLGNECGMLRYLPDVVVEHMHPFAGKAEMDEGYRRVNAPEVNAKDASAYSEWRDKHFAECVEGVREL